VAVISQVKLMSFNGAPADDWRLHQLLSLVESNERSNVIVQLCNYYGSVTQHRQVCTVDVRYMRKMFSIV